MLPKCLVRFERRLRNHYLDILEFQPFPLGQLHRMSEPADDKKQFLPGLQWRFSDYRMSLGLTGKMGQAHLGSGTSCLSISRLAARSHCAEYEKIPAGASGPPRL